MAKCTFAIWRPVSGDVGAYRSGPFKIVHHTTEGSSAEGAFDTYLHKRCDPHFTVDAQQIWQHIDTDRAARALRNLPGAPETNRDSAVQIEVVGFAHISKGPATLTNLARLCRWIETTHAVPRVWPSGYPKPAVNGHDPGGHNRDPQVWEEQGGHFGHCHVPENVHWDPGYTRTEVEFIMVAGFDEAGRLREGDGFTISAGISMQEPNLQGVQSTMPDHGEVEDSDGETP